MRRLIVCADGTWNRPNTPAGGSQSPTNVVKLARSIMPIDSAGISQVTFYRMGVGTDNGADKLFGGAFGHGLDRNLSDCYRFLLHNYVPGDELYFFGFSRGAYTVRSLGGLIRNCGLLRPTSADREAEALALYRDRSARTHPNSDFSQAFRERYSHDPVPITCIGVWDTVGALGLPVEFFHIDVHEKYRFHDVSLSSRVKNAFHAIAIDERRRPFVPTVWEQPLADREQNWLEQAWFPGVHSNVGGGYPDSALSDIALRWMIERVSDRCALEFDRRFVESTTEPSPAGTLYDSLNLGFKIIGQVERQIDQQAVDNRARGVNTWEYVHQSVESRLQVTADSPKPYRPRNLAAYLGRPEPKAIVMSSLVRPAEPMQPHR